MRLGLGQWLQRGTRAVAVLAVMASTSVQASVFANGKGLSVGGAVWGKRSGGPASPSVYQMQPERWSPAVLARVKKTGFGFVRLVTTPAPLMTPDRPARDAALAHIGGLVDQAQAAGLNVIVDLHFWPTDTPLWQDNVVPDSAQRAALMRGQVALAAMLAGKRHGSVALELVNEPPCNVGTTPFDWAGPQRAMVAQVRKVAPRLPLVLTGCRGLPARLIALDASPYRGDPEIFWTFHYYDPGAFGGQDGVKLRGVPFPPDPALAYSPSAMLAMAPLSTIVARPATLVELRAYLLTHHGQATIRGDMAKVAAWAKRYGIPPGRIFLGEFAILMPDNAETRKVRPDAFRWIAAVRGEAERAGFGWCYFGIPSPTNLTYDPTSRYFRPEGLAALGLTAPR